MFGKKQEKIDSNFEWFMALCIYLDVDPNRLTQIKTDKALMSTWMLKHGQAMLAYMLSNATHSDTKKIAEQAAKEFEKYKNG